MTDLAPVVDPGKFTSRADVTSRYLEGTFPSDRLPWVDQRILDVEGELIGLVPSLRNLDPDSGDQDRVARVRRLVADKVLDLFENPKGSLSKTSGMDGFTETEQLRPRSNTSLIYFTEQELNSVRLPRPRRAALGTFNASPWGVPC
jgi:hypothetical protein